MSIKSNAKYRAECLALYGDRIKNAAVDIIKNCDVYGLQVTCISCLQFDETKELCKLYKMRPPARVIAFGCPSYEDVNEIPF